MNIVYRFCLIVAQVCLKFGSDSVQSWCWRTKLDAKHFFNVVETINQANSSVVAPVETAEVEFDDMLVPWMECYHADLGDTIANGAALAARWDSSRKTWAFFIEREMHNLTKEVIGYGFILLQFQKE